jgi:hypothetical protein
MEYGPGFMCPRLARARFAFLDRLGTAVGTFPVSQVDLPGARELQGQKALGCVAASISSATAGGRSSPGSPRRRSEVEHLAKGRGGLPWPSTW